MRGGGSSEKKKPEKEAPKEKTPVRIRSKIEDLELYK